MKKKVHWPAHTHTHTHTLKHTQTHTHTYMHTHTHTYIHTHTHTHTHKHKQNVALTASESDNCGIWWNYSYSYLSFTTAINGACQYSLSMIDKTWHSNDKTYFLMEISNVYLQNASKVGSSQLTTDIWHLTFDVSQKLPFTFTVSFWLVHRVRSDISTTLTSAPIDNDPWCECRYDLTGVNCVGTPYERCTSGLCKFKLP